MLSALALAAHLPAQTVTYAESVSWPHINFDPSKTQAGTALDFSPFLDAPAGNHGAVFSQNGAFHFANTPTQKARFYGVNLCYQADFMTHAQSDLVATNLAAAGYNAVRIHLFDWLIAPTHGSPALDAGKLDLLQYLLAALKTRGIYYTMELYSSRYYPNSLVPGMTDAPGSTTEIGEFHREAVPLMLISDDLLADVHTFGVNLLQAANPYMGNLALKDDPALISLEFVNEDAWNTFLFVDDYLHTVRPLLDSAFQTWRMSQLPVVPDNEANYAAWLLARGRNIYTTLKAGFSTSTAPGLLVNKSFTDMSQQNNLSTLLSRKDFDYVDIHTYYAAPKYLGSSGDVPYSQTSLDILQGRLSSPLQDGAVRYLGKPFVIGEFDTMFPQPKRNFSAPVVAALAGLQDWSALFHYAYGHTPAQVTGSVATDRLQNADEPSVMLAERIASLLFAQGESQASTVEIPLIVTEAHINLNLALHVTGLTVPTSYRELGAFARIGGFVFTPPAGGADGLGAYPKVVVPAGMDISAFSAADQAKCIYSNDTNLRSKLAAAYPGLSLDANHVTSSTSQITSNLTTSGAAGSSMKIITPRSETFVLSDPSSTATGTQVSSVSADQPGLCFVGSIDGQSLTLSAHQLLLYLTDTKNTGSIVETQPGNLLVLHAFGALPYLAQQGTATFAVKSPGRTTLPDLWALRSDGTRAQAIASTRTTDGFTFTAPAVTTADAYFAYEVLWPGLPYDESFQGYSTSTPLGSQSNWTAIGSNPTPLILTLSGRTYLEDNGAPGANTQAKKYVALGLTSASMVRVSYDFYMGGGTTLVGLKSGANTTLGPSLGYSGGLYIAQPTGTSGSSFAQTAGSANITLTTGAWYRLTSTMDFGRDTATLTYQSLDPTTFAVNGPETELRFNPGQTPTTSLTADPTTYDSVYVRLANDGTSRVTDIQVDPVALAEDFTAYTGTTPLTSQVGGWTAVGANPSPFTMAAAAPPSGGKYLEDSGVTDANTQAQKNCGLTLGAAAIVTASCDLYTGGGTTLFGLKATSGTALGPSLGYSSGLYINLANGVATAYAKTTSGANFTLPNGQWYRLTSRLDFGHNTATLNYQTWSPTTSTWSIPVPLYFDAAQTQTTTPLTADPATFTTAFVRLANNGTSRLTNLKLVVQKAH